MENKEHIIQSVGDLFQKYGIKAVTMDRIAEELGISKRTLYEIFSNRNSLITTVLRAGNIAHVQLLQKVMEEGSNMIEVVFKVGKINHDMLQKYNPMFFQDLKRNYPKIQKEFEEHVRENKYAFTKRILDEGQEEGVFTKEINTEIVCMFFHEMIRISCDNEVFTIDDFSRDDFVNIVFLPYFRGISTEKGRRLIDEYFEKYTP